MSCLIISASFYEENRLPAVQYLRCSTYAELMYIFFHILPCYLVVLNIPALPIDEIDINQWQSISINQLILIIDDQSMKKIFVTLSIGINWHRLSSIVIDCHRLPSIVIDCHRLSLIAIDCYPREHLPWKELPIDANRWINCQSMPIDDFFCDYRLVIDWPIPIDIN